MGSWRILSIEWQKLLNNNKVGELAQRALNDRLKVTESRGIQAFVALRPGGFANLGEGRPRSGEAVATQAEPS